MQSERTVCTRVDADTTLLQTAPLEFVVSYNKYFHPVDGAPGCTHDKPANGVCSTAFAMKVSVILWRRIVSESFSGTATWVKMSASG